MIARAYLLGMLDLDQRVQVEREMLENEETYRQVLAAEQALIDEYVSGALAGYERRRFTLLFLDDPVRRERVERTAAGVGPASPVRSWLAAGTALLATTAFVLLLTL